TEQRPCKDANRCPMLAAIRAVRDKYVVKIGRLRLQDARLAGRKDRIRVMANRIRDDWPRDVVKCSASSRRPGTGNRIAHSGPRETVIIGALHPDKGRVLRIVVGDIHVRAVRSDPRAVVTSKIDDLRPATADVEAW